MRRWPKRVLSAVFLLSWLTSARPLSANTEVSIYVPPLDGPPGLARSVNTVIRLQIWQTLRKIGAQEDPSVSFGLGAVKWGPHRLPSLTYASADTFAHHARVLSQIVLFGTVQEYGNGVVVQAFLSIPYYKRLNQKYFADFRTDRPEMWLIRIPISDGYVEFQQDVPRRRLSFEPVILAKEFVSRYSGTESITMYDPRRPNEPIGAIGDVFEALEQREEAALVRSKGLTGLVRLPELAHHRSEIVDFASGVVRIFRQDWLGATALFSQVLKNPNAPTDVRIDAHLYRVMASARLGRPTETDLQDALSLNPYAVRTMRFAIMSALASIELSMERKASAAELRELIDRTRRLIAEHRDLFLDQDLWLKHVEEGLAKIEQFLRVDDPRLRNK